MQKIVIGGTYKHYKGNFYKVIVIGKHSETLEEMVVYEALYDSPDGKIWIRPLKMFLEDIIKDGKTYPRFELIKK